MWSIGSGVPSVKGVEGQCVHTLLLVSVIAVNQAHGSINAAALLYSSQAGAGCRMSWRA
jgi:hypothetical protein